MVGCKDCGLPYDDFGLDTVLSRLQWSTVSDEIEDILCANCMVKRASKFNNVIVTHMFFETRIDTPPERIEDEDNCSRI